MGTLRRSTYETDSGARLERCDEYSLDGDENYLDALVGDELDEDEIWDEEEPDRMRLYDAVDVSAPDILLLVTGALLGLVAFRIFGPIGHYRFSLLPMTLPLVGEVDSCLIYAAITLGCFALTIAVSPGGSAPISLIVGFFVPLLGHTLYALPYLVALPLWLFVTIALAALVYRWITRDTGRQAALTVAWDALCSYMVVATVTFTLATNGTLAHAHANQAHGVEHARMATEEDSWLSALFGAETTSDTSLQELADELQAVAVIEHHYLGLTRQVPTLVCCYGRSEVAGYDKDANTIRFNVLRLRGPEALSGRDAVAAVLHEMAHAYQCDVVESGLDLHEGRPMGEVTEADVETWRQEISSYIDGEQDIEGYWDQDSEKRAREFAQIRLSMYEDTLELD